MTPDPSFVKDLAGYDPKLRVRWARRTGKWFIERKMERRNPSLVCERPSSTGAEPLSTLAWDLWEGWKDGYLHILTVGKEDLQWSQVAEALRAADSWRAGSFDTINRELDERDAEWERGGDKKIDNFAESAARETYDLIAWRSGRRVAVSVPEPPLVDTGMGFKVRDRRGVIADAAQTSCS